MRGPRLEGLRVPLCGYQAVDVPSQPPPTGLTVIVVDPQTGTRNASALLETPPAGAPAPPLGPTPSSGTMDVVDGVIVSRRYFYYDLAEYLPRHAGEYEVRVALWGHSSNARRVRIEIE